MFDIFLHILAGVNTYRFPVYSDTTLSKEGIRGSKLEVTLEYTHLKPYEVTSRTEEQEFLDKYEKPTEESPGKGA